MEYAFYLIGGGLILLSSAEMIYISNRNERLSLFSSLFPKTLAIMILAILLVRKEVGIVSIALVFLMVGISYFLLRAFMWIRKGGFLGIDFTGWGYLVRKALPFFPFLLFAILYSRIGIIALAFMEGFKACGFFVPLFSMVGIVSLPLITPLGRFLPLIYSNNKGEAFIKKHVRNLKTIFLCVPPIATLLAFRAEEIIPYLFGEEFKAAVFPFQIIIWSLGFIYINFTLYSIATSIDRLKIILTGTGIGALFTILLNLYLIPRYGLKGICITALLAEIIVFIVVAFSLRKAKIKIPFYKLGEKGVVATMGLAIVLHYLAPISFPFTVMIGFVSYSLVLIILSVLEGEGLRKVISKVF